MSGELLTLSRAIAEDVFFPAALAVDRGERDVKEQLDVLAKAGLYGVGVPGELGGLGDDLTELTRAVETLAGGCLATTFVWIQHHGVASSVAACERADVRDEWLGPLVRGEVRAGNALTGFQPGPPRLVARRSGSGWVLDGEAAWVTGWRHIDLLLAVARTEDDVLVYALVDPRADAGLTVTRRQLVAVDASDTVTVGFDGVRVDDGRVLRTQPYPSWSEGVAALRMVGSLALGVAGRCLRLFAAPEVAAPLHAELDAVRARLDSADAATIAGARAAASAFAMRAATLLTVSNGSRSILAAEHAQRLVREATFLLVFASRAPIKAALLDELRGNGACQ